MKFSTITANRLVAPLGALAFAVGGLAAPNVLAQSQANNEVIEEVVTVGTRGKPRSVSDSPVPVDVITSEDFSALGNGADITDNLKALVPSYTATPATGDGSAFVRPTSLRGTAPDQTLVLVNGKRRHRSALVQFFAPAAGNGAHGVDIGMIPGIAIKRVEVLRDGAAAQYGSDAIAGVLNFVTKDAPEGGEVQAQFGEFFEGEQSVRLSANAGFGFGNNGFVNASIEHSDNDALSRGVQRPDAQALADAGVIVGADSPFGDSPLVQTWGRPETAGTKFFANAGLDLSNDTSLYARLGYADTEGRYRFFYRPPTHITIQTLRWSGFTGLQGGYTPYLDGFQEDISFVTGVQGELDNDILYDVSIGYGHNELDYFLNNTINESLRRFGSFDTGGYEQTELNLNADFAMDLNDTMTLGFGGEWREETYTANAGEEWSWTGNGSNGLKGITPQDAGDFDRDNFALYGDIEHEVSDALRLQYAARFEDFSDFGNTLNGKLAALYRIDDGFVLRGAISTGFHAPTPGQANVRTTITTFDGVTGLQVEEGLVPSTDPRVSQVGGTALKEEESVSYSAGTSIDFGDVTTITLDYYKIEVDDRIYRTGDIAVPGTTNTISFYTNALDVEHSGFDFVLTSDIDWSDAASTRLTFAYNFNQIEVVGQSAVGGVNPVSEGLIQDIENNYPQHRWGLTTNTLFGSQWNLMVRATYYGEHWDERGQIGAQGQPSSSIDPIIFLDLEVGYDVSQNLRLVAGGVNVADKYVGRIGAPFANRQSVGLQYPRRSAANYEGGSWYLRGIYRF